MITSYLHKPSSTEQYLVVIILLLLLVLALVAWQWVTTLPGPIKSVIGWASIVLAVLLASELLPWQQVVTQAQGFGAVGMAWMDTHPLVVLLVLPAMLFGSIFWNNPV